MNEDERNETVSLFRVLLAFPAELAYIVMAGD